MTQNIALNNLEKVATAMELDWWDTSLPYFAL